MNSQFFVPKPCHENWNAMTPAEQGRFCSLCSKSVTDFTQMSNDEIIIYLKVNKEKKVCGRFRTDQLEEKASVTIPEKILYSQKKFINVFLLALLITMGSMLFSCQDNSFTTTGEVAETPVDTVAVPPPPSSENYRGHTMGMVIASPDDSIHLPPLLPIEEKQAPKSSVEAVVQDSINHK